MEFIAAQTSPETVSADFALSEILGAEIEAWLAEGAPAVPPAPKPRRMHTYVVGRWAVIDGDICTWLEQVTEED